MTIEAIIRQRDSYKAQLEAVLTERDQLTAEVERICDVCGHSNEDGCAHCFAVQKDAIREQLAALKTQVKLFPWEIVGKYKRMSPELDNLRAQIAAKTQECEQLKRIEQVCYDLHGALGVKWGDDPYAVISNLREQCERLEKERDEAKKSYERLRESVNGCAPRDLERLAWFEANHFKMEADLRRQLAECHAVMAKKDEALNSKHKYWLAHFRRTK